MNKRQFVRLFQKKSDALFRYYLARTGNRTIALKLTEAAFKKAWDMLRLERDTNEIARTISVPKANEREFDKANVISFNSKQYGY